MKRTKRNCFLSQHRKQTKCEINNSRNLKYLHPYQLGWSPMPIPAAPSLSKGSYGGLSSIRLKKS